MKKLFCIVLAIICISQSIFGANLYIDKTYKDKSKGLFNYQVTDKLSNGVLYNNQQLRVDMGTNHYMKCKLAINQVKPNSLNQISVVVHNRQIVTYTDFTQNPQDFYVWTDSYGGDLHIRFYSIDLTTNKPNEDVWVTFSEVQTFPNAYYEAVNNIERFTQITN